MPLSDIHLQENNMRAFPLFFKLACANPATVRRYQIVGGFSLFALFVASLHAGALKEFSLSTRVTEIESLSSCELYSKEEAWRYSSQEAKKQEPIAYKGERELTKADGYNGYWCNVDVPKSVFEYCYLTGVGEFYKQPVDSSRCGVTSTMKKDTWTFYASILISKENPWPIPGTSCSYTCMMR